MDDDLGFFVYLAIVLALLWMVCAFPAGRAAMRQDLYQEGYRVVDSNQGRYPGEPRHKSGEGRWHIQVLEDGEWVDVQR